ncbi:alpha/beta hydrolase [Streptomyces eurythermus]
MLPGGPTGHVRVEVVRPADSVGALPVVLFLHGLGHVLGDDGTRTSSPTHVGRLARTFALGTDAAVVLVDYASAPEAAYPVAVEQCYAVARWLGERGGEIGLDGSRMVAVGDSVGGNLVAALTLLAKERGGIRLVQQVLLCPVTDTDFGTSSYREFAEGYFPVGGAVAVARVGLRVGDLTGGEVPGRRRGGGSVAGRALQGLGGGRQVGADGGGVRGGRVGRERQVPLAVGRRGDVGDTARGVVGVRRDRLGALHRVGHVAQQTRGVVGVARQRLRGGTRGEGDLLGTARVLAERRAGGRRGGRVLDRQRLRRGVGGGGLAERGHPALGVVGDRGGGAVGEVAHAGHTPLVRARSDLLPVVGGREVGDPDGRVGVLVAGHVGVRGAGGGSEGLDRGGHQRAGRLVVRGRLGELVTRGGLVLLDAATARVVDAALQSVRDGDLRVEVGDHDGVGLLFQLAVELSPQEPGFPAGAEHALVRTGRGRRLRPGDSVRAFGHRVGAAHEALGHIGLVQLEGLLRGGVQARTDLLDLPVGQRRIDSGGRGLRLLADSGSGGLLREQQRHGERRHDR